MMGTQAAPTQLFYDFCLDDHVPDDHLLRRIDQFLDLETVRSELKPFYSSIGRPSINPELMMRMLIVGYCLGIRSERRLCEEVHLNLAYRWFCRLGLDSKVPDHSTFSRNRARSLPAERYPAASVRDGGGALPARGTGGRRRLCRRCEPDRGGCQQTALCSRYPEDLGPDAGQAVLGYLAALDDAAFGAASEVKPKFISPSDPAAQCDPAGRGGCIANDDRRDQ